MTEFPPPPKPALDAETDQGLAYVRDSRQLFAQTSPDARLYLVLASGLAAQLREQFPGIPAGRVLMAVAQSLTALVSAVLEPREISTPEVLLTVAALAAQELDAEQVDRG